MPLPFPLEGSTDISHGGIEGEEGRRRRTGCMLPVLAIGSRLGPLINFLLIDHFIVVFSLICKGFSNNSTTFKHPEGATPSST